jgi:hypothetical protein
MMLQALGSDYANFLRSVFADKADDTAGSDI